MIEIALSPSPQQAHKLDLKRERQIRKVKRCLLTNRRAELTLYCTCFN